MQLLVLNVMILHVLCLCVCVCKYFLNLLRKNVSLVRVCAISFIEPLKHFVLSMCSINAFQLLVEKPGVLLC